MRLIPILDAIRTSHDMGGVLKFLSHGTPKLFRYDFMVKSSDLDDLGSLDDLGHPFGILSSHKFPLNQNSSRLN